MNRIFILIALSTALVACGGQSGNSTTATSQNQGAAISTPQGKGNISKDRTTAFKSFMPTVSTMRKMAKGDEAFDAEKFKAAAAQFTKEARIPFESFQSDPNGNGDALPAIWQKPAEFKAEQDKFLAAVDKLNTVAQTGKLDDIKVAFDDVQNSCKSCHQSYRVPK